MSAEEKGLPITTVLGDVTVGSISGGVVSLAGAPPALEPGDIAYLVDGDDAAGLPGWLFGKITVDAGGARGVAHYRAVDIASDNRLGFGTGSTSTHVFPAPSSGEALTVSARVLSRAYAAPVANGYGWQVEDSELVTDSEEIAGK
jgi:hypothetical protein